MSLVTSVMLTPGISKAVQLGPSQVRAVKISNTSKFDTQYSGFGTPGPHWVPAGTEYMVYNQGESSGTLNLLPFDNSGVGGTGNLLVTQYLADETVPTGTWPIAIPTQTVSATVGTNTLSNEGSVVGTEVIDIGTVTNPKLVDIFNNKFVLAVEVGGVKHVVLTGSITGNPGQLGQLGDTTEVVGILAADGNATVGGTLGVTGNVTHSADTFLVNKKLSTSASGDLCDWSGVGVTMKGNPASHGSFVYQGDGTHTDWQLSVVAPVFSGTGGGTFNHNATQFGAAVAPTDFIGNPCTAAASSNSVGFGSITTTQVSVGSLNAVAWRFNAVKV